MVESAALYRIPAKDAIRQGVNLRYFVGGTQSHVNFFSDYIVARCACLAVESKNPHDIVFVDVDHADRFTQRIDDVHFSKGLCVGYSIWLRLCRQALYDRHRPKVNDAALFFTPAGGGYLVQSGDVLESGG